MFLLLGESLEVYEKIITITRDSNGFFSHFESQMYVRPLTKPRDFQKQGLLLSWCGSQGVVAIAARASTGCVADDAGCGASAAYSKLARYAPGVVPTMRLNQRVRWAWDENPQMWAMSASDSRPSAMSAVARLMRRSVR